MLQVIRINLSIVPKTLACLIWCKIKNGIELNDKEYKTTERSDKC